MADLGDIVVVCGPTATGKSALALALARRFGGELVGADSMQIYSGLTVGTAAVTPQQAGGVLLHLTGFLPPEAAYSVADWLAAARKIIGEIRARGALPVVCGGTGLYLKSLVEGRVYRSEPPEPGLRLALEGQWNALGAEGMLVKLAQVDPEHAARLHVKDKKRILRALEQCIQTGLNAGQRDAQSRGGPQCRALCIGLSYPDRADLYAAIDARVDAMMADGLLDEARMVYDRRAAYVTAAQAIGYKELFPWFEGEEPLEACVGRLKQATRNYAKRQLTWFGRMHQLTWLDAADADLVEKAAALTAEFLSGAGGAD